MSEMIVIENRPLTAVQIRAQVNIIQEVMKAVMQKGTHYGTVPGCGDKPTLLKPGAEKLLATFRIAVDPIVEDMSTHDCFRYRVICRGVIPTGEIVGGGVGECSTDEEKYKWRSSVCDEEYESTPEDRRRNQWKKGAFGKSAYQVKQVRTNPADLANTVLKMAKKRAQVDLCLTATGASDIFTQDIEELPAEYLDQKHETTSGKPPVTQPQSKKLTETQTEYFPRIKAALDTLHGTDTDAKKATLKTESFVPAKGTFKETAGVEDYRTLDGKRLQILAQKLEALAKKKVDADQVEDAELIPAFCNECRTEPCSCDNPL